MRNFIYVFVVIVLSLMSIIVLFLYYTQGFEEDISLKGIVQLADLEIQESMKGTTRYLTSAKGELGTLTLTNSEGIFSQVYTLPQYVGCIDLKEGVNFEDSQIRNFKFSVRYLDNGVDLRAGRQVEIPVGKEKIFTMVGEYTSYNVPLSAFSAGTIKSISLYRIPENQRNPIDTYDYTYRYSGKSSVRDNCNEIRIVWEPEKVIPLN